MPETLQEELDALHEAAAPLKKALMEAFLPLVEWVDRQLRHCPRLYARLGGGDASVS